MWSAPLTTATREDPGVSDAGHTNHAARASAAAVVPEATVLPDVFRLRLAVFPMSSPPRPDVMLI
jgi:hypothetical protein